MSSEQARLLRFAVKYRGWQGYGTDQKTVRVVNSLVRWGLIEVNKYRQFRLKVD